MKQLIEILGLKIARNLCQRYDIATVEDTTAYSDTQLLNVRGMGPKRLKKLRAAFSQKEPTGKELNSCLKNARPNEPLFILRAQDTSSPKTILYWIADNFEWLSEQKTRDAFETALKMKKWPKRKLPD